ncbi:MAG: pantoate--beta-alanine ligase [Calditrichaeota bacterium]|nr:pantoate--beta-alanine ligase [Calditrichota bacterium]
MQLIHDINDMQTIALRERVHKKIALVPTMGYLHEGHLSLIRLAKQHADIVIISIFVNPSQFGPNEDLDKYPRDLENDLKLCEQINVDYVFNPEAKAVYPHPFLTQVSVTELKSMMCGISRQVHFDGVALIVNKLLNICQPHLAVFGLKDYQQFIIIQRMVNELNIPVKLIGAATVREADGLALSSRNKYLDSEQRKDALILYQSLQKAKLLIENNEKPISEIKTIISADFKKTKARLDYFVIKDAITLQDIEIAAGKLVIAIAAYIGKARLIDNIQLTIG